MLLTSELVDYEDKEVLEFGWVYGQCRKYLHWPWTGSGVAPSIYNAPKFQYCLVQEESPPVKRVIPLGFCYWGALKSNIRPDCVPIVTVRTC